MKSLTQNPLYPAFIFLSTFFVVTVLVASLVINIMIIVGIGKFVGNHNFAIEKYSGTIGYISDINDQSPYVADTEGENHMFYDKEGAVTLYPFSRYEPRDGTFLQVFEIKLYNSKTQRLHLLRLIW